MKVVIIKQSQRNRPGMCPWLIDSPSESDKT